MHNSICHTEDCQYPLSIYFFFYNIQHSEKTHTIEINYFKYMEMKGSLKNNIRFACLHVDNARPLQKTKQRNFVQNFVIKIYIITLELQNDTVN